LGWAVPLHQGQSEEGRILLRIAYIGLLALATLAPFDFQRDPGAALIRLRAALNPDYTAGHIVDAVRNIALFGGWGALWTITAPPGTRYRMLLPPFLTGLALSVIFELTQAFLPLRNTSILDVAMNGLGALAGAILIVALVAAVRTRRHVKSHLGLPAALFAGSYLAALTLEAIFAPFRITPIAGIYGGPLLRLKATLAAFDWRAAWDIPTGDILLFLPAGFLAVAALVELGWQRLTALRLTIAGGALLWAGAELLHGFLALPIGLGAFLTHALSMAAGALLASRFLPAITRAIRGSTRPRYLFWCYTAVLLLWTWRPWVLALAPDIAAQFSLGRLIPLQGSAYRLDLYSVADIVESFLLYLPLGALLAVWPFRHRGALSGYLPGVYLAAIGELGQPFIAARYFDVTDILVGAAGLGIGWAVVRRAGFSPYGEMLNAAVPTRAPG